MENLTKHQIVLLTLLVSFVTSMATGIVAVSLMNQAPEGVTQTINRIVERTIEKVSTPPTQNNVQGQTTVKETVVVSSDDQVVKAIDKNSKSLIRVYRTNDDPSLGLSSMTLVGIGIVVTDDQIVAVDGSIVSEGGKYFTPSEDGNLHELSIVRAVSSEQVALMKIKQDDKNPLVLPKVSLSTQGNLKLGQTVVYIGGETKNIVATGIVSSFGTKDIKIDSNASSTASSTPTIQTIITYIETTVDRNAFIPGGLLLNLSGELVGIKSTYLDSAKTGLFAPSSYIKSALDKLVASSATSTSLN